MGDKQKKVGTLLFIDIGSFFTEYLKERAHSFDNFEILVASSYIIADSKQNDRGQTLYLSRYDNITFVPNIKPAPIVEEYYCGSSLEVFGSKYKEQLGSKDCMINLCSIVDMVVNEGVNVVILCSLNEYNMEWCRYLKEYLYEAFSLTMCIYSDFKENPKELHNIGDVDNIRLVLRYQIEQLELVDEVVGKFFNKFTKDMVKEYTDILMSKSVDELYQFGISKNVHVNKRKPKKDIVDHIMLKLYNIQKSEDILS